MANLGQTVTEQELKEVFGRSVERLFHLLCALRGMEGTGGASSGGYMGQLTEGLPISYGDNYWWTGRRKTNVLRDKFVVVIICVLSS